jgi:hypothetical protein
MSNLDNIFDLQEGAKQYIEEPEQKQEKKQRKKVELSDDKKAAMLERLKVGREKRQENLKAKKGVTEPVNNAKNIVNNAKHIVKEVKEVKEVKNNDAEKERLAFVNMMAGKSKPSYSQSEFKNETKEKFERPKKKVYETKSSNIEDVNKQTETKKEDIKEVSKPIVSPPVISSPIVAAPVIIRTFKKPIWG